MPQRSLILQALALGAMFTAAAVIQLMATLYWVHRDGIRWSIEQLTPCELEIPEELREVVVEERRARIVPDTITRLIADLMRALSLRCHTEGPDPLCRYCFR